MTEIDFLTTTKQGIPRTNDRFRIILKTTCLFLVVENIKEVLEKVMESHGILKRSKDNEP